MVLLPLPAGIYRPNRMERGFVLSFFMYVFLFCY
uniref:Uncharacterized protein n=1 Tax=virus sp. ctLl75 TaxID=2828249 RepID=A0A8S5RB25_9VIRU|nr:MAG TPA: hypothetical protein [virus sp. ctLl75]DAR87424.1 MAG TPA: hypothetical protein [Caudoviricetes sp.]